MVYTPTQKIVKLIEGKCVECHAKRETKIQDHNYKKGWKGEQILEALVSSHHTPVRLIMDIYSVVIALVALVAHNLAI